MHISELNFQFDSALLQADVNTIVDQFGWGSLNQISLRHTGKFSNESEQVKEGCGSLYDRDAKLIVGQEQDYKHTCNFVKDMYLGRVLDLIHHLAKHKIGRARLMNLASKTCYSWHKDSDEVRYHIPITTNRNCLFLTEGDNVLRMPKLGQLYILNSNVWHTALNASWQDRVHLVISTW